MAFGAMFIRLCNYLQDPCLVAGFQKLCGVQGTSEKASHSGDKLSQSGASANDDGGTREYPRERNHSSPDSDTKGDLSRGLGNGSAAPRSMGAGGEGQAAGCGAAADTARAKPLRKNSLTGDVGHEFIINNKFLFYLFTFGTELGNEMFFIVFFPFVFWNVDTLVSRRLIIVWAWNLFIGQSTKDLVRWSRPASPPVVKVEVFYNSEYSMPSTHAMTGTAMSFSLFMLSYGRWEVSRLIAWCMVDWTHSFLFIKSVGVRLCLYSRCCCSSTTGKTNALRVLNETMKCIPKLAGRGSICACA